MKIAEQLMKVHSKANCMKVVDYVGTDKRRFRELMDAFLGGQYRLTQRAAWPLGHIAYDHPSLIQPFFKSLLDALMDETRHPSCARNILRILQVTDIPEEFESVVFDYCMSAITDPRKPVAIRAFSITVATRIASKYPPLKGELRELLVSASGMPQTAATAHRLKTAFKAL